jgi:hypothetical protein
MVLPWPARALIINVTYDSTVTSSPNASQIESAYGLVVQNLETLYTNPETVNITVFWGSSSLGMSQTSLVGYYSYPQVTNALWGAAMTPEDSNAVESLPPSNPISLSDHWVVPRAEVKALPSLASYYGINPNDNQNDGNVYFESTVSWTFNPLARVVPGAFDFIAVAEHETTEAMGRIYDLAYGNAYYLPFDLFRFTNEVRTLNALDTGVYFSVNNGVTALKPFHSPVTTGDAQDWAPTNLPDSFDWEISPDEEGILTSADLTALDILGYDLNFTPPKISGTRMANGNFDLTFTNVTGLGFTVWGSTNIAPPATNWVKLGTPSETSVGQYQFIDTAANKTRFYRVLLQ